MVYEAGRCEPGQTSVDWPKYQGDSNRRIYGDYNLWLLEGVALSHLFH